MSALPKQLMSAPRVQGAKAVKSEDLRIHPVNATGNTIFSFDEGNSTCSFMIPALQGSFYNPAKSYLSFKIKTNSGVMMAAGCPIFRRMTLKTGNGQLIESIDGYSAIQRALSNFESVGSKLANAARTGDFRANTMMVGSQEPSLTTKKAIYENGTTIQHELLSGILGKGQEFYVPLHLFNASGGFAFNLELELENPQVCCVKDTDAAVLGYSISDVEFQMNVVKLDKSITDKLDSELYKNSKVSLPLSTYRLHQSYIPAQSQLVDLTISESAHDLECVYSLIRRQNLNQDARLDDTTKQWKGIPYGDQLNTLGWHGDRTKSKNDASYNQLGALDEYSFRYGTEQFPSRPAIMGDRDSTTGLLNAIHTLDMADKDCFVGSLSGYNGYSNWEQGNFAIVQSFKRFRGDNINAGLNSSSTGTPLELMLKLKTPASEALRVENYVKFNQTLHIMKGGQTSLINGTA